MTAKTPTAASMVAAQTMSTPISVGPCWAPEKAAKTRLLFIGRPALNLERNHARHDEGAEAHPDEPAAAGDHQPLLDRKSAVSGQSVSVRVDRGGRRTIKKKK